MIYLVVRGLFSVKEDRDEPFWEEFSDAAWWPDPHEDDDLDDPNNWER